MSYHFEDEYMSSQDYDENSYGHALNSAIILHYIMCVSYPMRRGCKAKSVHLKPTYLKFNYSK